MRIVAVVMLAACGGELARRQAVMEAARESASGSQILPPTLYSEQIDAAFGFDLARLDPAVIAVEDRCLTEDEIASRREAVERARDQALVEGLAGHHLQLITLEWALERNKHKFDAPWMEVERDGARWLVGSTKTIECGQDHPEAGESRFVITRRKEVLRVHVRYAGDRHIKVRTCPRPCGSGYGAGPPCTAKPVKGQIRWKLPAGAQFAGHFSIGLHGFGIQDTRDPRPVPCPGFPPLP